MRQMVPNTLQIKTYRRQAIQACIVLICGNVFVINLPNIRGAFVNAANTDCFLIIVLNAEGLRMCVLLILSWDHLSPVYSCWFPCCVLGEFTSPVCKIGWHQKATSSVNSPVTGCRGKMIARKIRGKSVFYGSTIAICGLSHITTFPHKFISRFFIEILSKSFHEFSRSMMHYTAFPSSMIIKEGMSNFLGSNHPNEGTIARSQRWSKCGAMIVLGCHFVRIIGSSWAQKR